MNSITYGLLFLIFDTNSKNRYDKMCLQREVRRMKLKTILAVGLLAVLAIFIAREFIVSEEEKQSANNEQIESTADMENIQDTGLQIGETAPDFTLTNLQGESMTLSDFRGQKVILNFWASWCGPCRAEMPDMQKFYEATSDQDIEVLAVNLTHFERQREHVDEFVEEFGLTFPIPLDVDNKQYDAYKVLTIPTTYFLDEQGIIQQKHLGPMSYEFMEETISEIR